MRISFTFCLLLSGFWNRAGYNAAPIFSIRIQIFNSNGSRLVILGCDVYWITALLNFGTGHIVRSEDSVGLSGCSPIHFNFLR